MTKSDWQPSSWLALIIASIPCFKWENVQPDDVITRMPDLLQRLSAVATGNVSRRIGTMSRNYTSERRSQTDNPYRSTYSSRPSTDRPSTSSLRIQPNTDRPSS